MIISDEKVQEAFENFLKLSAAKWIPLMVVFALFMMVISGIGLAISTEDLVM
jgi:hypothetical protein